MPVLRSDIEKALDEIISNEEGMRFQGLAVVLAKKKWKELIACERKKDLGADALARATDAPDGKGKVLACSLTAELAKIREDADKVRKHFDDVSLFIFATPNKVTNHRQKVEKWSASLRKEFGFDLIVLAREEIISLLLDPANTPLCRTQLGIPVPFEQSIADLHAEVSEATSELTASWSHRIAGKPLLDLRGVELRQDGTETGAVLRLNDLLTALTQGRRLLLEAPAGRGKTTTLIQLARQHASAKGAAFLIDLPLWTKSGLDILQFLTGMRPFQARSLNTTSLARLYDAEHLSFLLNGWNEIAEADAPAALTAMAHLERMFPAAGIIVATRAHHITPPLPGAMRIRLLPLNRAERAHYVRERLAATASQLVAKLDREPVLDQLTRTPLILSSVCDIFASGAAIPGTKMAVLQAIIHLHERSEEHCNYLQLPPLGGQARVYLEGLAGFMTQHGRVMLAEGEARSAVNSTAAKLHQAKQITAIPEPQAVLNALCARHLLERLDYPGTTFRFEHQQFQEFFAAIRANDALRASYQGEDDSREFLENYVNAPAWAEPLRMIAEHIGAQSADDPNDDAAKAGYHLVTTALNVDPVFAAELAQSCGPSIWVGVKHTVARLLRAWYQIDGPHRECALAAMVATGSADFADIILPLASHEDRQIRLSLFWPRRLVHLSTFKPDWRQTVRSWKEEARVDFVSEMIYYAAAQRAIVDFAIADPSMNVRKAAIRAFAWVGTDEEIAAVLAGLDVGTFQDAVQDLSVADIPLGLRPRAQLASQELHRTCSDPLIGLRHLLKAAELGGANLADTLKAQLTKLNPGAIEDNAHDLVASALRVIRDEDSEWVNNWVAERTAGGSLWRDDWLRYVGDVPAAIKQSLVEKLESEDVGHSQLSRSVKLLAQRSDIGIALRLFRKLCALETETTQTCDAQFASAIRQHLSDFFRAIPANIAVAGLGVVFQRDIDPVELRVAAGLIGRVGRQDTELRTTLESGLRQGLRAYLKNGVAVVLRDADYSGARKADLATALGEVGDPQDMDDLRQLIRADIERVRNGRAARARGETTPIASGAFMSYSNWHVSAVVRLDPTAADSFLLELLNEPEYEHQAALTLLGLARIHPIADTSFGRKKDFGDIWLARAGRFASPFDEKRRARYSAAIKTRINRLLETRHTNGQAAWHNRRAKDLAIVLAELDGRSSADLVLKAASLSGDYDAWVRIDALEKLLFAGAQLPVPATLQIIDSVLAQFRTHDHNDQHRYLLQRILCLLPFLDSPSDGFAKMREIIAAFRLRGYELRETVAAVAHSRFDEALNIIRETLVDARLADDQLWQASIDALATLDTLESRQLLLGFVDPDAPTLSPDDRIWRGDGPERQIVALASKDERIRQRLLELCSEQLPGTRRDLLANVMAQLDSTDAMLASLNLIDDQAAPPVPRGTWRQLEQTFVEHRPERNPYTFTLTARSSNTIRTRLFEMATSDGRRKKAAFQLLGQVELWRLEHGRPITEPRHPALASGTSWPLIPGHA